MQLINSYALVPNDSHKSFHGKAIVKVYANGDQVLESYGLPVMRMDGKTGEFERLQDGWYQPKRIPYSWGGGTYDEWVEWSATTGRHILAFSGINKAEYMKMPVVAHDYE